MVLVRSRGHRSVDVAEIDLVLSKFHIPGSIRRAVYPRWLVQLCGQLLKESRYGLLLHLDEQAPSAVDPQDYTIVDSLESSS